MSVDIVNNRRAFHNYQICEKIEAGIELRGTEVKSIRAGSVNLNNAFARVENNEVFLYDADIQPYARASHTQHEPKRPRKLLLHKPEIVKLFSATAVQGQTLVALRLYWKNGRVKVELGLGRGKSATDKRHDLKEKAVKRETDRAIAAFNRRRG
ncbi:MAG: SsrA-binding protein SmpB [Verrucomicrobia bacterium]|jgi:SsrA-binding protein|nr:SsrA-binding protein SmpB [Verrucomicrobiota bacterium]MBV8533901.1 SsrA-binding protein SmpB [Verrucomicrobiota bacterium]